MPGASPPSLSDGWGTGQEGTRSKNWNQSESSEVRRWPWTKIDVTYLFEPYHFEETHAVGACPPERIHELLRPLVGVVTGGRITDLAELMKHSLLTGPLCAFDGRNRPPSRSEPVGPAVTRCPRMGPVSQMKLGPSNSEEIENAFKFLCPDKWARQTVLSSGFAL